MPPPGFGPEPSPGTLPGRMEPSPGRGVPMPGRICIDGEGREPTLGSEGRERFGIPPVFGR
jgi:hypothetical protein